MWTSFVFLCLGILCSIINILSGLIGFTRSIILMVLIILGGIYGVITILKEDIFATIVITARPYFILLSNILELLKEDQYPLLAAGIAFVVGFFVGTAIIVFTISLISFLLYPLDRLKSTQFKPTQNTYSSSYSSYNSNFDYRDYPPSKNYLLRQIGQGITGKSYNSNDMSSDNAILRDIHNHLTNGRYRSNDYESDNSLLRKISSEMTGKDYKYDDQVSDTKLLIDIAERVTGKKYNWSDYPPSETSLLSDIANAHPKYDKLNKEVDWILNPDNPMSLNNPSMKRLLDNVDHTLKNWDDFIIVKKK